MPSPCDNNKRAAAAILLVVMTLAVGDALVKAVSSNLTIWQIFVLRSSLAALLLLVLLRRKFSSLRLRPNALAWTALRSAMLVLMWLSYYAALPQLELSVAAAAYYTLPIFITLFSAVFAGERVRLCGWLAVVLGFGGVILILQPTAAGFNAYALLPLLSAILYALAMVITRTKCRSEHPLVLAGALHICFIAVGLAATFGLSGLDAALPPFLTANWSPLGWQELLAILTMAGIILAASIGTATAYQIGRASVVATFDIAYVAFAALCGFLFFGEVPTATAFAGMAMIAAAGAMALRQPSSAPEVNPAARRC